MVVDELGRTFKKLRVSLTDSCDFACLYCVEEDEKNPPRDIVPSHTILSYIKAIHRETPLFKVIFTGGEPLLYPYLNTLIQGVKQLGIEQISITTNGFLLGKKVEQFVSSGLTNVNISLDAVNATVFKTITRRDKLASVLETIDACLSLGVETKINAVIVKDLNENQVMPLIEYGRRKNVPVRFLELMQMGYLSNQAKALRYNQDELLFTIAEQYHINKLVRHASDTANYWQLPDGYQFGIIANTSEPFCHDCDRLRLDYKGNIYGCLSSNYKINISNQVEHKLPIKEALQNAIAFKKTHQFSGNTFSMKSIGG